MLAVQNITLFISNFCIFSKLNFQVNRGDRIGLVGSNGAGKTTLLRLIKGKYTPEEGDISLQSGCTIGFLEQDTLEINLDSTVRAFALQAFAEVQSIEERQQEIGLALAERTDYESEAYKKLLDELEAINNRYILLEGDRASSKTAEVLEGLGFSTEELDQPLQRFSGGWRMRAVLAKLLLERPDLLMLDEPTNHLDIDSIEWLEQYLKTYDGAVVIVSHDRFFLNRMVNQIAELRNKRVFTYTGNYDKFEVQRAEQVEQQQREYESQQREIAETERFIERFRYKATKARQAQSRVKKLERMERIEAPEAENKHMDFRFPDPPSSGKVVIEVKNLVKSYHQPDGNGRIQVFTKGQDLHIEKGDKIALIGPNGAGKSTLARILYGQEPFDGNRKEGHNVMMTFFAQHLADVLESDRTIYEEMESQARSSETRQQIRNILGSFLFSGDDVFKSISVLSGGERGRVALAKTLLQPANFLILDEPTNHLDMNSKDVLIRALKEYKGTILAVSHDRYFLSHFANKIWRAENGRVTEFDGGYDYYEWKRAKDIEEDASAEERNVTNKKDDNSESELHRSTGPKSKEQKRKEAELRNVFNKKTKSLRDALSKTEDQLEKVETRKAELEKLLADAEFYQKEDAAPAIKEHADLSRKADELTEKWTELSEQLETVEEELRASL